MNINIFLIIQGIGFIDFVDHEDALKFINYIS